VIQSQQIVSCRENLSAMPWRASLHELSYGERASKKKVARTLHTGNHVQCSFLANFIHLKLTDARHVNRYTVLANHKRAFRRVFALAQVRLRADFGMELVELPAREKVTLREKRQGTAWCVRVN